MVWYDFYSILYLLLGDKHHPQVPLSLGLPQTMLVYQRVPIKSIMTNFNLYDLDSSWKIPRILALFSDLQAMDRVAEKVEDSWLQQWLWRTGWKAVISVDASIITCFFFSFFCLGSAATMHEHVWTRKGGANHKSFQVKLYPTLGISWNKNMYSLRFLFQKKGLQDLWGLSKSWGTPISKGFCQRNLRAGFGTIFCTIKIAIPGFTENKGAGTRFSCKWLAASLSCCWLNPGFAEFIFTKRPCACFVVTEQGTSWECKISKPVVIRP